MNRFVRSGRSFLLIWLLLAYAGTPADSSAQTPTLTATFRGLGADVTGPFAFSPDGLGDYRVALGGLRAVPERITVRSDVGGIWATPFNGENWMVLLKDQSGPNADIYFSEWPSDSFRVQVVYPDGTFDEAESVSVLPPSTLTAGFRGLGADVVSPGSLSPDGLADYRVTLGGLRASPIMVTVISDSSGVWRFPFDGTHWMIRWSNQTGSGADIHFSEWPSGSFRIQVAYADGSYDQTDSEDMRPPSTLTATFRGPGADVTSPYAFSPDGIADYRVTLGGLRTSISQITVTSDTGGIWSTPFNGTNWMVRISDQNDSDAEIHFSQWTSGNFRVEVRYTDGSNDAANSIFFQGSEEADVVRLLRQATFGPTPDLVNQVKQYGIVTYIDQQMSAPLQDYPNLGFWPTTRPATCIDTCQRDNYTYYPLQKHFFSNALGGEDQLRQRVALALSEILVTSAIDVPYPAWMRSYQQLLYSGGFGNFRQLLYDVTLHPTMGRFLDMQGSRCQRSNPVNVNVCRNGLPSQPNENYAREILQLFSIGTFLLDQDGTRILDRSGNPIPSYDQRTIREFARAFTGWMLAPNLPGSPEFVDATVPNYRDPMVVRKDGQGREDYHDRGEKVLLNGVTLIAGRTAEQDLNDAIDNIAYHSNVAPFISKQLIQRLVTSNPSPAYVRRVADVFALTRYSPTQLFQVVRAILLDPEARTGYSDPAAGSTYGKLREPALLITGVLRAFGGSSDGILNSLNVGGSSIGAADLNQDIFNAPSVFNYFPPTAPVPGEASVGPEFAIFSSLSSLRRDNFVYRVVFSSIPAAPPNRPLGTSIDFTPWEPLAADPDALLSRLDGLLLGGSMSAAMRQIIKTAVLAIPATDPRLRVRTAVYLVLTSSQYQVER